MTIDLDNRVQRRRRVSPASRRVLAGCAGVTLLLTGACSSKSDVASSGKATAGAVRMAFGYGFGGGGPEGEFIAGLNCYAKRNNLPEVTVTYANGDASKQLSDFDSLIARASKIDGIFTIQVDPVAGAASVEAAQKAGIVVIDPIGADANGKFSTGADSHVSPDDAGLPKQIVGDIVADHPDAKKMVLMSPPPGLTMTDTRAAAVTEAAKKAGLDVVSNLPVENMTTENAQKSFEDLLSRNPKVDVVFSQNGAMARGVALAAKSQGVKVAIYTLDADPETIAAVKSGDIAVAYGADLFKVAVIGSEEVQSIKAGKKPNPRTVPYVRYDKDHSEVTPISKRCSKD